MDAKISICLWMLIVLASAIKLNITDVWRPEFGWEVTCTWEMPFNDSLQSVRLSNDGQQFMIYRPERHGPVKVDVFGNSEKVMRVDCGVTEPGGQKGQCVIKVEPLQAPAHNFALTCEVSGERPTFRIVETEHIVKILVPPSNATLVSATQQKGSQTHVSLNCSSFGLPAPNLMWTMADDKHAQADHTGRMWNMTTKLWHVWSFYTYTTSDHPSMVTCTPVVNIDGERITGVPAQFNSATRRLSAAFIITTAIFALNYLS